MRGIEEIEEFIKTDLPKKPSWGAKEIASGLTAISNKLTKRLEEEGTLISVTASKKHEVSTIKRGDIIYGSAIGIPHYLLVHKVVGEIAYCLVFTSKDHPHLTLHIVEQDRILKGSIVSTTYTSVSLSVAKESFIRTYESKKELSEIFKKITAHYRKLFR